MKILLKVLFGISLLFMCLFVCVGYASLTSELTLDGTVDITPPEELFITSVTGSGTNGAATTVNSFTSTIVSSRTNLGTNKNATATYRITVYNNTDTVYGYSGMIYTTGEETYDNTNIKTSTDLAFRTAVNPGQMLTFDVTVSYINTSSISNTVLNSLITYKFLPLDEIPETEDELIVSDVLDQFKNILNNNVIVAGGTSSEILDNQMNDNEANNRPGSNGLTYIGNVSDASDEDKEVLDILFQGKLSLYINGEEKPVTIIIKKENIDGGDDIERVIYMTTDGLTSWLGSAEVYVAVFKDVTPGDGEFWVEQGDMYHGTASIVSYDGSIFGTGSFNTDRWRSTKQTVKVTDNYSYTINASSTIETVIQATDINANNELLRILNIAHTITNDGRYIGSNVDKLKEALATPNAYYSYQNGNYVITSGATRAQLVPIIKQLDSIISQIDIIQ